MNELIMEFTEERRERARKMAESGNTILLDIATGMVIQNILLLELAVQNKVLEA